MLRIIAGERRGTKLHTLEGEATRPLRGRVRESLFNIIRPELPDAVVLDLFAGTGAVGLEALSRGASGAAFIEGDKRAAAIIERNIAKLRYEDRSTLIAGRLPGALGQTALRVAEPATLVFIMPPYHSGTGGTVLAGLRNENLCAPQALAVLEIQSEEPMPDAAQAEGWELEDDRTYGVTRLLFYRAS